MVKIGVIGAGMWGKNHVRTLSGLDCNLAGLADINPAAEKMAAEFGISYHRDYRDMLKEVDAVTVAVPTDLHYGIVKECLRQKKHVMVEKPITLESEKARELVSIAKNANLILSVGYLYRFNASVVKLKELLKDAGRIQYITGRYIHSMKPPRKDSGAIFNLGIHLVDILNFILEERPVRVFSKKINCVAREREDSAVILLDYGEYFANLEVSCCHPLKRRDMWIIAEKQKIYADFFEQTVTVHPIRVRENDVVRDKETKIAIAQNEPLREELKHFCNCVSKKDRGALERIMNIGEEEYYTTRLCELSLKSAETGRELTL
ncbi:MAG: Gfo/Idh/MocA family oxidoreductase [archaeon]